MSKQRISQADTVYYGSGVFPPMYSANQRTGVPINFLTKLDLGSPIPLDADSLIKNAKTTQLPTSGSIVYTAGTTSSPQDTANTTTTSINLATGGTDTVLTLDVPRNVTVAVTHTQSIASGTVLVTGYDEYKQSMSELYTIAAGDQSAAYAGKKAFKYIKSVTFTAGADMQLNSFNVGHGNIFGLPYALQAKADLFQVYRNDVEDTSATIVAAVATTATTSTGDVRGTVATGVAADTTSVVVWGAFVSPNSTDGLRGVAQA